MEGLKNKDKSILKFYDILCTALGQGGFELLDFWQDDLFAVGFVNKDKLVYVSTWNYRFNEESKMLYYSEFEILNPRLLETKEVVKIYDGISKEELLNNIKTFWVV